MQKAGFLIIVANLCYAHVIKPNYVKLIAWTSATLTSAEFMSMINFISSITDIHNHLSHIMRKTFFAYGKTKTQISWAVTAQLISAFVFAT